MSDYLERTLKLPASKYRVCLLYRCNADSKLNMGLVVRPPLIVLTNGHKARRTSVRSFELFDGALNRASLGEGI